MEGWPPGQAQEGYWSFNGVEIKDGRSYSDFGLSSAPCYTGSHQGTWLRSSISPFTHHIMGGHWLPVWPGKGSTGSRLCPSLQYLPRPECPNHLNAGYPSGLGESQLPNPQDPASRKRWYLRSRAEHSGCRTGFLLFPHETCRVSHRYQEPATPTHSPMCHYTELIWEAKGHWQCWLGRTECPLLWLQQASPLYPVASRPAYCSNSQANATRGTGCCSCCWCMGIRGRGLA